MKHMQGALRGILLILLLVMGAFQVKATHLRAGEITVEKVDGCGSLTVSITITVYTDTGSNINFGQGELFFGDGSDPLILPIIEEETRPDLGDEVGIASFTVEYTYNSPGVYKIGYLEPNRNDNIVNVGNSVQTRFYVETQIIINPFVGCNNSPVLLIPPIDRACTSVAFFHNPGAFDPDGDSIAFELVVPKKDVGTDVDSYRFPNEDNLSEQTETGDVPPIFEIDPITGDLTWDAPGLTGEYTIAFVVKEFRKIQGEYFQLGYVTRDMQIIVEDCDNERPELEIPDDICVVAGTVINEEIFGFDPDNDDVKIEVFSEILDDDDVTIIPSPAIFQPSVPRATLNFEWATDCADVRTQSYQVVFKITDNPPPTGTPPVTQPRLVSFATWNITVVAPSPEVTGVTQDGQSLVLNWEPYNQICANNLGNNIAESFEIWRRVDSNPYTPDECETGIRESAGYELIGTSFINNTSFRDDDVVAAAKYCYRIVAVFPSNTGGAKSIVSQEVCFEFVPAEVPIITHVSVDNTGENDGEIIVGWREPFPSDLDPNVYPHPYRYVIERNNGAGNTTGFTEVGELVVNTPTTDSLGFRDTGLNTANLIYNYRIRLEIPNGPGSTDDPVYSAIASAVRLEPTPQFQQITLNWSADVPWSNVISTPPGSEHLIYRGPEGSTDDELVLLDRIDVNERGFVYTDTGLDEGTVYCYKVLTKGTYGNPAINTPLLNFSQMVCTQPSDTIPPCAPVVTLEGFSCEDFLSTASCDFNNFANTLQWTTDFAGNCQNDIREYEVWYKNDINQEYQLIGTTRTESFVHEVDANGQRLSSFKGCYQIRPVDRSGNVGEFSNEICVDNCPYYELPNVFTPNGDGCNDLFSAYSDRGFVDETGSGDCGPVDRSKCARFVRSVDATIYNRWGGVVFTRNATIDSGTDDPTQNIFIDWNGTNENGEELATGVYYYKVDVIFDVVDPSQAKRTYKGWVHLLR
jgi:hypothetical protein